MENYSSKPVDLIKNKLARRGYEMKDSKELLQGQKGNLIYLKKKQSNIRERKHR